MKKPPKVIAQAPGFKELDDPQSGAHLNTEDISLGFSCNYGVDFVPLCFLELAPGAQIRGRVVQKDGGAPRIRGCLSSALEQESPFVEALVLL